MKNRGQTLPAILAMLVIFMTFIVLTAEKRSYQTFMLNDCVEVVDGFYRGTKGHLTSYNKNTRDYTVYVSPYFVIEASKHILNKIDCEYE